MSAITIKTDRKVAVVILNWNGAAMMRRFLPSVVEGTGTDGAVIVADNGQYKHYGRDDKTENERDINRLRSKDVVYPLEGYGVENNRKVVHHHNPRQ